MLTTEFAKRKIKHTCSSESPSSSLSSASAVTHGHAGQGAGATAACCRRRPTDLVVKRAGYSAACTAGILGRQACALSWSSTARRIELADGRRSTVGLSDLAVQGRGGGQQRRGVQQQPAWPEARTSRRPRADSSTVESRGVPVSASGGGIGGDQQEDRLGRRHCGWFGESESESREEKRRVSKQGTWPTSFSVFLSKRNFL